MNTSDSIYMFWSIISARESLRELKEFMHVVFIGFRHRVLLALSCCKASERDVRNVNSNVALAVKLENAFKHKKYFSCRLKCLPSLLMSPFALTGNFNAKLR